MKEYIFLPNYMLYSFNICNHWLLFFYQNVEEMSDVLVRPALVDIFMVLVWIKETLRLMLHKGKTRLLWADFSFFFLFYLIKQLWLSLTKEPQTCICSRSTYSQHNPSSNHNPFWRTGFKKHTGLHKEVQRLSAGRADAAVKSQVDCRHELMMLS